MCDIADGLLFDNAEKYRDYICGLWEGLRVADIRSTQDPDYFVIHCPHRHCMRVRTTEAGDWAPFVEGDFRKFVAEGLSTLVAWGKSNGFSPESFKCCGICAANADYQKELSTALTKQFPEAQIEEKSRLTEASSEDIRAAEKLSCEIEGEYYLDTNWDDDKAINAYEKAINIDPDDTTNYYNRGRAYGRKGAYDRAIDDFSKVISLDPKNARAYNLRGKAYSGKREPDKAIENFSKAISLDPDCANAYHGLGNAHHSKSEHDKAIENFSKAISLDPDCANAYHGLGNAHHSKSEHDKAIENFSKAIDLNPYSSYAYFDRAFAYFDNNESAKAIEDFSKAMLNPELLAQGYHYQARAYECIGDNAKAKAGFKKSLGLGYFEV